MITVEKPSNADKVRAMDDLTLADFMYRIAYCGCSREDMYEWLKLESDDSWQKELMRMGYSLEDSSDSLSLPSWWSAVMRMIGSGSCMMRTVIRRGMSIDE